MKLIYEGSGEPVKIGDVVPLRFDPETREPELHRVTDIETPRTPASTGRVYLESPAGYTERFYPSVIGAVWDERPDREAAMREGYEEAGRVCTSFGENHHG